MRTTDVFTENVTAYNDGHKIIINKGSARSSKNYSILQVLYLIAVYSTVKLIITVVSRTLPHLRAGAMRDFDNILIEEGIHPDKVKNKTESYYRIGISIIEFVGADQTDKVHGPSRDILYINEAYFIKYEIFTNLLIRTAGAVFIDYNPINRFWLDDEVMKNESPHVIHSTYVNNQYLPAGIRVQLDKKRERYDRETESGTITKSFKNWCKVYLFGEDGAFEGVIFDNWRYADDGEIETAFNEHGYQFALDYGFFPDPDACSKMAIDFKRKIIYAEELIYETNNGTEDLIKQLTDAGAKRGSIIAESASPRTNHDLKKRGFTITPVNKRGTVSEWLREMQNYQWVIGKNSLNFGRELQNYVWSDKKAGIPIDEFNHLIDGARYVYMMRNSMRIPTKAL